jgi:hypothetical protein
VHAGVVSECSTESRAVFSFSRYIIWTKSTYNHNVSNFSTHLFLLGRKGFTGSMDCQCFFHRDQHEYMDSGRGKFMEKFSPQPCPSLLILHHSVRIMSALLLLRSIACLLK